jgi:hypothetical protein
LADELVQEVAVVAAPKPKVKAVKVAAVKSPEGLDKNQKLLDSGSVYTAH